MEQFFECRVHHLNSKENFNLILELQTLIKCLWLMDITYKMNGMYVDAIYLNTRNIYNIYIYIVYMYCTTQCPDLFSHYNQN